MTPRQPDPAVFFYAVGLLMAAALYGLFWFFAFAVRPA
jgi:hypothetical protein